MLERYNFVDISIFMRTSNGLYLNLTDFILSEENDLIDLGCKAEFVLVFFSFKKKERYVCDITLSELLKLANITDKAFIKRLAGCSAGGNNRELLAIFCAKEIVNYRYGRILKDGEFTYTFHRQSFVKNEEGKKKRVYPTVLKKEFYIKWGYYG